MPKAVRFDEYGGLDVLQVRDVPRPVPVSVAAAIEAAGRTDPEFRDPDLSDRAD